MANYLSNRVRKLDVGIPGYTDNTQIVDVVGDSKFNGSLQVIGTLKDSSGDVGTSGQVLSSTASGTNWINPPPAGLSVYDETTLLGTEATVTTLKFTGNNIVATRDGNVVTVNLDISQSSTFGQDVNIQNQFATKYYELTANGSNYVAIRAPASLSADVTLTLPSNDGDADQVLATDGNGNLSWVSRVSGSGTTGDFLVSSTSSEQSGYFGNIYLKDDSNTSHYLEITNSDDLTALRTLSIDVNDANRTIQLSGNLTLANNFTTAGNFALTLTTTASTSVTLPTSGTLATLSGTEQFSNKTFSDNVAIGISTAQKRLHVYSGDPEIVLLERSSNGNCVIQYKNTDGSIYAGLANGGIGWGIDDDNNIGAAPYFLVERTTGNVGINTTTPSEKLDVAGNIKTNDSVLISDSQLKTTTTTRTESSAQFTADTFVATSYRTTKYLIEVRETSTSNFYSSELLLMHDGTDVYITEYGTLQTATSPVSSIDADISTGNVRLLITPSVSNTITKVYRISLTS